MARFLSFSLAAALVAGVAQAPRAPLQPSSRRRRNRVLEPSSRHPRPGGSPTLRRRPLRSRAGTAPQAGEKIDRFEAVGNTSVASDTIRVYLGVNPGDPYNPDALQKNFLNLWQTGLFDDIRIEADRADNGVVIRAIVKERPRIGSVEYRGNKELTTAKINEAFERDHIDLHVGNTVEQTLVRRAADAIKKTYTEGGYEGVTVSTSIEDLTEPGEKKIVFIITEGTKPKVATVEFTGNNHFSNRRLLRVMKEVKEHNIVTWIRKKDLYIPSKLDEDLERVKNFYQDYGYQNVSFGEPQVVNIGKNPKKARVKLVIPVKEGEVHTFGEVTVSGNTVFTRRSDHRRLAAQEGRDHPAQGDSDARRCIRRGVPHARLHLRIRESRVRREGRQHRRRAHAGLRRRPVPPRPARVPGQHDDERQGSPP